MPSLSRNPEREASVSATVQDVTGQTIKSVTECTEGTLEYRLHFRNAEDKTISPWHSVPLSAGEGLYNFVCEIPRNTRAKYEVATGEAGNPIKQDSKKGKPRSYAIDILWNYGMLPQTWEDPCHASEDCDGHIGDNDPVDIVEIGDRTASSGSIYPVKPIAAFAMIDEGELDWKVVAISTADPRCVLVNDVEDMETYFPGTLSAIREWFRTYKTFDGKPLNKFALGEQAMNKAYTQNTIAQTHAFWRAMVDNSLQGKEGKVVVGPVPLPKATFDTALLAETAAETKEYLLEAEKVQTGVQAVKDILEAVAACEIVPAEIENLAITQQVAVAVS